MTLKTLTKKILQWVPPVLVIMLTVVALHHISKEISRDDIFRVLADMRTSKMILSGLATVVSFLILTALEILGFHFTGLPISNLRVAKVSFIAFGVSNTLSLGGLAGASIRFRLYLKDKIDNSSILQVTAFSSVGVWIGFFILFAINFLVKPIDFVPQLNTHPLLFKGISTLTFIGIGIYVLMAWKQWPKFQFRGKTLRIPSLSHVSLQIMLSTVDWLASAAVLYVLLPESSSVDFSKFLYVFLAAQIIGSTVNVPGGLGILEALTVFVLTPDHQMTAPLATALLVYRFIYYLIPLAVAIFLLVIDEITKSSSQVAVISKGLLRLTIRWVPVASCIGLCLLGASTFIFGIGDPTRSPASESSLLHINLYSSLFMALLVIVADGVRRRSRSAYLLATTAFFIGSILMFLDRAWPEMVVGLIFVSALLFSRSEFFRKSRITNHWGVLETLSLLGIFVVSLASLLIIPLVNPALARFPWWSAIVETDHSPISIILSGLAIACGFAVWRLVLPNGKLTKKRPYAQMSMTQARPVAMQSPVTQSQLVLLQDKEILPHSTQEGFIMYGIQGSSWISLGDPVSPIGIAGELVKDFYQFANIQGGAPVFYQTRPENLFLYVDYGYKFIKIGEEAIVDLAKFTLEGRDQKSLRNTLSRFEREGISFEILAREEIPQVWDELKKVSDEWLSETGAREKGFSLGFFNRDYLENFPFAILRKEGKIISFANIWMSDCKTELSVDLMRSSHVAPSGAMEYLFTRLLDWGKKEGYRRFNLGMAPLSGLNQSANSTTTWNQFGSLIFETAESLYNFRGVRRFKEKFNPTWEPRYLAYPKNKDLTTLLTEVALLVGKGKTKVLPTKEAA